MSYRTMKKWTTLILLSRHHSISRPQLQIYGWRMSQHRWGHLQHLFILLPYFVPCSISLTCYAGLKKITHSEIQFVLLQVRVTVFPEHKVAQYGGMPWWVILVAILLGLLLLGLLVFLLWKVRSHDYSQPDPFRTNHHFFQHWQGVKQFSFIWHQVFKTQTFTPFSVVFSAKAAKTVTNLKKRGWLQMRKEKLTENENLFLRVKELADQVDLCAQS